MGKLDAYKNNNPDVFKTTLQEPREKKTVLNLLMKLESYELGGTLETNFAVGTRLDTGEPVKVRLYEIDQNPNSKYSRIEIANFADPRHKHKVILGNFLVFEQAREDSQGVFSSRWCVPLDRDPNGTKAYVMLASLRHFEKEAQDGTKTESWQVRALHPKATTASSLEDLDASLIKILKPQQLGSKPQAFVRITDDSDARFVIEVYPLREEFEEEDGRKYLRAVQDPAVSLENFKKTSADKYKMISDLILDPEIKVEVIGCSILYPGSATKEKLDDTQKKAKRHLIEGFYVKNKPLKEDESAADVPKYPEAGFQFCVIGNRVYPDGTPYLTYIKPLFEYTEADSINDVEKFSLKV